MTPVAYTVRPACVLDARELLVLMRKLARFEGYIAQFCVSEDDLLERGLRGGSGQQFAAFVADTGKQELLAYAMVYTAPYTFDVRPNLVLKELYVRDHARGLGIGQALMAAVQNLAKQLGRAPDSAWKAGIKVLS